jgi:hypothetical protein
MNKTLDGDEHSQLLVNTSGDKKVKHQIDCIENVLPSCDLFSDSALFPRIIFSTNSEKGQLARDKFFKSLVHREKRKSIYKSHLGYPHLIIDVGELYTRAIVFGVVEDTYRLIAIGESISTHSAPNSDIWIGVKNAVKHLDKITGFDFSHEMVEQHAAKFGNLLIENSAPIVITNGSIINVGILYESYTNMEENPRNLLNAIPCNILFEEPIDTSDSVIRCLNEIVITQPDLILCAKETGHKKDFEKGNSDFIQMFKTAFSPNQIPWIFNYQNEPGSGANNQNITNDIDPECEKDLLRTSKSELSDFKKNCLVEMVNNIQAGKTRELIQENNLDDCATVHRLKAALRVIQFLDETHTSIGGVLGVNLGYTGASITSSIFGDVHVNSYPEFGLRSGIRETLQIISPELDLLWKSIDIEKAYIEEYLSNKSVYPFSIPVTDMDLEIEYAIESQNLFSMINKFSTDWEFFNRGSSRNKTPYELIIASGYLFSLSQDFVKDALVLLNGIQPVGVVSMLLDRMDLIPAIGAAAEIDTLISVQVMESDVFTNLGTFICADSGTRTGTILLKVKINYECGKSEDYEIKKGDLVNFSLSEQEHAELVLQPLYKCDIGMGPGKGGKVIVNGGCLGIVIDARGRPIPLPENKWDRVEKIKQWESSLHRFK